jgi:type IV pilus assembly protein PilA
MKNRRKPNGFTLTELMISDEIIGVIGSIALTNYSQQLERSKQNNMAAAMEQLLVRVVSSKEEIGIAPTTWEELNDQAAIMTKSGPASTSSGTLNQSIDIAGSSYTVKRTNGESESNYYIFAANTNDNSKRNILGCIDLGTGASDVKLGVEDSSTKSAVTDNDLNCK